MKRIDFVHFLEVLQAMRKIDLSSKVACGATLKKFQRTADDIGGQAYVDILRRYNINTPEKFCELFSDDDFIAQIENDRTGKNILNKIIFGKRNQIEAEAKETEKLYGHLLSEDINDVEDYDNTYVLREKDGNGPIVFAEIHNYEKDINRFKTWYAWRYGVDYMKVTPCGFEFWINHPDRQNFSNKDLVRKYHEEHDNQNDIVEESVNDIPVFNRGDMVEDEKGNGYIVIDTFTSEEEITRAKKKRPYRVILPKDYNVSNETPVVAVMTIKAEKRGLNYIYPISKFSVIGNDTNELDECNDILTENLNESMTNEETSYYFDELEHILGTSKLLLELQSYMGRSECEEFIKHVNKMYDLDLFNDSDNSDDLDDEDEDWE